MNIKLKIANCLLVGLFMTMLGARGGVQAQTVVVVNSANSVTNISKAQLLGFYRGDEIVWKNTSRLYPVTLRTNQAITKTFFEKGLGLNVGRAKRLWLKLALSGKTSPPKILNNAAEVVEYVSQNEGAIGFIPVEKLDERVKVITINGRAYSEKEYFLSQNTK